MKKTVWYLSCLLIILVGLSAIISQPVFAQPPSAGYVLLYEDHFQGNAVNELDWSYRLDRRQGGSFNALNLKENVFILDGLLHIVVRQDTINDVLENTGGGLISKHQFGYGYYETLSKPFMAGTGVHSAFWQAGGSDPKVENRIFEIDSYEIDSKTQLGDNNLYVHICPEGFTEVPWPHRAKVPMSYREDGWLLDAFEYTPEGVTFYDNGKVIARAEWKNLTAAQKVWLTALNGFGKIEKEKQPGETVFDYFRYYAKDYPGINILPNGNFEYNQDKVNPEKPVAWYQTGTSGAGKVLEGNAFSDKYFLRQGSENTAFSSVTSQKLEYIMNGKYQLSAMVRSSGGQKTARMRVYGFGGKEISLNIGKNASWSEMMVPEIEVSNNQVTVEFCSDGSVGQWLEIDDVKLNKPALPNQKTEKPEPFVLIGDPIWHLAKKQPISFTGDQKFYFFDRNVGFGEAMTVSFVMKAGIQADMSPIARIPKSGNSGWAIQLTKEGGLIFRIGSKENHHDVVVPKVYKPDKECQIACVFNQRIAEVYVDGKLLKIEKGISQDTKDSSSAGRLGDVGESFQVIADVFIPEKDDQARAIPKQGEMIRFKGNLKDIRVYNRAISNDEIRAISSR